MSENNNNSNSNSNSNKIFVGNVSFQCNKDDFQKLFFSNGRICRFKYGN